MIQFPAPEYRTIRNSDGRERQHVRYPGQTRWYGDLATAQIAWQRDGRPVQRTDTLRNKWTGEVVSLISSWITDRFDLCFVTVETDMGTEEWGLDMVDDEDVARLLAR